MPRINFAKLLLVIVLTLSAQLASAFTLTAVQVGHCKSKKLPAYNSISAALAATPAPDVVEVCPGTYYEQIQITRPVFLVGISSGNSDQVIIAPPAGGLLTNASDEFGDPVAAQLWVNNVVGQVSISDITLDASNHRVDGTVYVVGVFYQDSSGTLNRVSSQNHSSTGPAPVGVGIWLEGGPSNPSVTIKNSSIRGFNSAGISAQAFTAGSSLTAIIEGNDVYGNTTAVFGQGFAGSGGIDVSGGVTATVTNNFVATNYVDILTYGGAAGSISSNLLSYSVYGVQAGADNVTVTLNKIFNSTIGVQLDTSGVAIQNNTILSNVDGIVFACFADGNVRSNTITNGLAGLVGVPSGMTSPPNSYFNVGTIRAGDCP